MYGATEKLHSSSHFVPYNAGIAGAVDVRQFGIPAHLADKIAVNLLNEGGGAFFVPGKRRRLNCIGILLGLVTAPIVVTFLFYILTSEYRYHNPRKTIVWAALPLVWLIFVGAELFNKRGKDREPMWLGFIFCSMVLGLIVGSYAGNLMYEQSFLPYYDMMSLNDYPNVNPGAEREPGDIYLDAGFMGFVDGTELDLKIVGMYVHEDTFCVAPIVNMRVDSGFPKSGNYDFWAVGKNCCNNPPGVFMCGAAANVEAGQGLRETNLKDIDMYKHAIQQANAKYNINTEYPLMVHWVQDPLKLTDEVYKEGIKWWYVGLLCYLVVNTLLVIIALVFFARLGHIFDGWPEAGVEIVA
jgi:hypothetical protein